MTMMTTTTMTMTPAPATAAATPSSPLPPPAGTTPPPSPPTPALAPTLTSPPPATPTLLALDAGTRTTGWAVFHGYAPHQTGLITIRRRQQRSAADDPDDAASRIPRLLAELDALAAQHAPTAIALYRPNPPGTAAPAALDALAAALAHWSQQAGIPLTPYPAAAVRRAVAGHPRAAPPALAHAVMTALNLLGARKSAHEWTALAVGAYHLYRNAPPPT